MRLATQPIEQPRRHSNASRPSGRRTNPFRCREASLAALLLPLLALAASGCAQPLPQIMDDTSDGSGTLAESDTTDSDGTMPDPPQCGNGIIDAGESCDEGEESATCDVDCTPVDCGDGLINREAGEHCDEGEETEACNVDCTPAACGDGVINPTAGEQCDAGGKSAFCDVDCTPASCGDGVFNALAGEECDEGGSTAACNDDCTLAECGDRTINVPAGEECDEGGETASCNGDCSFASCGDGITNQAAGETCDDAGPSASCDANCTSVVCGDATANTVAGEECDGTDLAGAVCESLGLGAGTLACDATCAHVTSGCAPGVPAPSLSPSPIKRFDFAWAAVPGAEFYRVRERIEPGDPYVQLGGDIIGESASFEMPLHFRFEARYSITACNDTGCTDSLPVDVSTSLAEAVGYVKASNTDGGDGFGWNVALSGDGNTLAVGADAEDGGASGIDGDQVDESMPESGAVYVFVRDGLGQWSQQAYIKASNVDATDRFGSSIALSFDGDTLAVGAPIERSNATGVGGNQADNSANGAGAAYVFVRDAMNQWSQQQYIKASNTNAGDEFGDSIALSGDGDTLVVGAQMEDSLATGINGNQADNGANFTGSVYVFVRNGAEQWSQQAYVKASNTEGNDRFGASVALDGNGDTLAVGANAEDSNATGIGGNQANNSASGAGAVYVFVRSGGGLWSQQAYVKASNTAAGDGFGASVTMSADGNELAVGAPGEDSVDTGVGGNPLDNSAPQAGAVYVFTRSEMGVWSQYTYIKASNTAEGDEFGGSIALSAEGNALAVGADGEGSIATGVAGNEADDSAPYSGAAYVYERSPMGPWIYRSYVKASNTESYDFFGYGVTLSGDGNTLAVGAGGEDGSAPGIDGDQTDNAGSYNGAVYLY